MEFRFKRRKKGNHHGQQRDEPDSKDRKPVGDS